MIFKGRFRTVRHKDHAVPAPLPRPLPQSASGQGSSLDIRAWPNPKGGGPLLLVTSPRKSGPAIQRNQFRRRVRMAFLGSVESILGRPWVVWVRPSRTSPPLDAMSFQDIEHQIQLALRRLPPLDTP